MRGFFYFKTRNHSIFSINTLIIGIITWGICGLYFIYLYKSKSIQMKVLCNAKQSNLTENKLYKVVEVKPRMKTIFYKVISDDNKCRWYESKVFRYPKMSNL